MTLAPTYRNMGDHTETVELDFQPDKVSLDQLLQLFWKSHNPNRKTYKDRQYISILFFRDPIQQEQMLAVKNKMEVHIQKKIHTEIVAFSNFTLAEDYHQKYYLKRYPNAMKRLLEFYPTVESFHNSTLAARLNGFVKGYGSLAKIRDELKTWEISKVEQEKLLDLLQQIRW